MTPELELYRPVAEAIALLLSPSVEVVVHDFATGCIGAVFNNLSKRKVGDESLLDEPEKLSDEDPLPPYFKINWDGRKMKSVSALLKNRSGQPIGLLCINLDVSKWEGIHGFILELLGSNNRKPEVLFKNDWREKINVYVSAYCREHGFCKESAGRAEKRKLLLELRKEGAFESKHAAAYVADVLQISRATVYNYLKERS